MLAGGGRYSALRDILGLSPTPAHGFSGAST